MPKTLTPPLVIFHGPSCFDGFTAAWVFKQFRPETVDFYPAQYGDAQRPNCKGREVWILDFSYPRDTMKAIIAESAKTTVIDHHKTAEAALDNILVELRDDGLQRGHDKIIFDMQRSGAGITFDVLEEIAKRRGGVRPNRVTGKRANWVVDYVEDRDLWKFALEGSREVTSYISTLPQTFEAWTRLQQVGPKVAAERGGYVQAYIDQYGEKACATARMEEIAGHVVPTMTLAYMNCSEHVEKLLSKHPDAPFAASYFRRADGKWQFSLRSRSDFDVSKVAETFGGGGHKGAAGFEAYVLPWEAVREPDVTALA